MVGKGLASPFSGSFGCIEEIWVFGAGARGRVITDVVPFDLIQSVSCPIPCLQLEIP
jgi:hypothetical protein